VEDPREHDLNVAIGFTAPLTDQDLEFLRSHGVTIFAVYEAIDAVFGRIPDESIPEIRLHPGVRYVEAEVFGCLAGQG